MNGCFFGDVKHSTESLWIDTQHLIHMYSSLYFNIKKSGRWSLYCYNDLNNWYIYEMIQTWKRLSYYDVWICNSVCVSLIKIKKQQKQHYKWAPPFFLLLKQPFCYGSAVLFFWGDFFFFAIFHCLFRNQFSGLCWWQLQLQRLSNLRAILSCCLLLTGVKSPIETWITLFPVWWLFLVCLSTVCHPALGSEAATRLFTLHQGTALVADYSTKFRTYTSESGWKNTTLRGANVMGLSEEFKDELAVQDEVGDYETVSTCDEPQYLFQGGAERKRVGDHIDSGLLIFSGSDLSCPAFISCTRGAHARSSRYSPPELWL